MKAVLTFVFFIFIATTAMAQAPKKEVKVKTMTMGVELNITIAQDDAPNTEVARLYKFKNSRVKKALKFTTKNNRSKIA